MNSKKKTKVNPIQHERDYIEFLKKRLASKHFLANAKPEEIELTKNKLSKARLVLRCLEAGK